MKYCTFICILIFSFSLQAQSYNIEYNSNVAVTNIYNSSSKVTSKLYYYSLQTRHQLNLEVSEFSRFPLVAGIGATHSYLWDNNWFSLYLDNEQPARYGVYLNLYFGTRLLKNSPKYNLDIRLNNYLFLNKLVWIKGSKRFSNELDFLLTRKLTDRFSIGTNFSVGLIQGLNGDLNRVTSKGVVEVREYIDLISLGIHLKYALK